MAGKAPASLQALWFGTCWSQSGSGWGHDYHLAVLDGQHKLGQHNEYTCLNWDFYKPNLYYNYNAMGSVTRVSLAQRHVFSNLCRLPDRQA
jgi:hypothetical protein